MLENIYNAGDGLTGGSISSSQVHDLIKAMNVGSGTGRDLVDTETAGGALKTESLDPSLKVLTNTDKHIVFYKMLPKQKAYNNIEEFNQLNDYGADIGVANNEGETPQFTDSVYTRKAEFIKYYGVSGEVTHPMTLVKTGSGVGDVLAKEVQNKMQFLVRKIDGALITDDSAMSSQQFDGIYKQHFKGISSSLDLDAYANDSTVVDLRGKALKDDGVENAVHAVVNDNYGMVSTIVGNPMVFSDYVKRFHESKRVNVGQPGAVVGATTGQSVNTIQTQFGSVDIKSDIFFDRDRVRGLLYNAAASSTKAPAAPVTTTVAAASDAASTKFGDGAGDYFYAVAAKNRYGRSALVILNTTAVAVSATQSVDLTFAHTDGAYAAESFVIYRSVVDATPYTTTKFYPVFEVTAAQRTAGYDGGAAGVVRDRNRYIANTSSAIVTEFNTDVMALSQLAPMMRMDLARTSPSFRFMVLAYMTPILYAPRKMARIINCGSDITA